MATMKFAQMATKKLQKLVNDPATSDEDKVAIQAVLDKRQAAQAPKAENTELTPEEQAAIKAAEAEASKEVGKSEDNKKAEKKSAGRPEKKKLTMEELDAECEKAEAEAKGHKCTAILPGTAIRVNGYVKSILKEKRAMRCYLLIQSEVSEDNPTGRQFYKVFGAEDTVILPEVVELKKRPESHIRKAKADPEAWLAQADAVVEAASVYIGRQIDLEDENKTDARVETIIKDKRSCTVFFRVGFKDENGAHKFTHKAVKSTKDEAENKIVVEEPAGLMPLTDEDKSNYDEWQSKWQTRAERMPRTALTAEEKVLRAEKALEKAKANLEKAQEAVTCKQLEYDNAKAALDAQHDAQEANAKGEGVAQAEASDVSGESGDLM